MPFKVAYDEQAECVVTRVTGQVDVATVRAVASAAAALLEKHHCHRVLDDAREAESGMSTFDIYDLPKSLTRGNGHPRVKRAVVVNEAESDRARFFETVSVNQGLSVRVFTDIDKARGWLAT